MASVAFNPSTYEESCPLLCELPALEAQPVNVKPTPLPMFQLAALCSVRIVDPIAFTQLFPYVNEFMNGLHLTDDPSKIGFYSGLVVSDGFSYSDLSLSVAQTPLAFIRKESICAIFQLCFIYHWARLSDVIGRRPVILFGTVGLGITTILFGLSRSLTEAMISRALAGVCAGNVAVFHAVLGELTDHTNQVVAFPVYGLFWPLGSVIGPLLGGTFSNPATKFPGLFNYQLFRTFPYFLPCFLSAVLAFASATFAYHSLDETLPGKRRHRTEKVYCGASQSVATSSLPSAPASVISLLSLPVIRALCTSGCVLSFIATAFDVVFVLFCYSPIHAGGLDFTPSQIGLSLAGSGSISIIIQLFLMPVLMRKSDATSLYNYCMYIWPYTFLVMPLLNVIAQSGVDEVTGQMDSRASMILWIGMAFMLIMSRIGSLAYSVSMILVKENTPSPSSLGATNGLVQFAMCLSRAFAPAFVSSTYALSVEFNILGGYFWVVVMVSISILGYSLAKNCNKQTVAK